MWVCCRTSAKASLRCFVLAVASYLNGFVVKSTKVLLLNKRAPRPWLEKKSWNQRINNENTVLLRSYSVTMQEPSEIPDSRVEIIIRTLVLILAPFERFWKCLPNSSISFNVFAPRYTLSSGEKIGCGKWAPTTMTCSARRWSLPAHDL